MIPQPTTPGRSGHPRAPVVVHETDETRVPDQAGGGAGGPPVPELDDGSGAPRTRLAAR
jgi:hypothetical protein